jgi:CheY-like chemotaxis protein
MQGYWLQSENPIVPPPHFDSADGLAKETRPRVLVVDDEAIIADTLALILNRNGFEAVACYSGRDAVDTAKRMEFETILSDVAMPHFDGVEAAIAIRELRPGTRIVLFSGQSTTVEILERARQRGHDFELLPKPIHPSELLRHLRSA